MKKLVSLLLCAGLVTGLTVRATDIEGLSEQQRLIKALQASKTREGYLWAGASGLSIVAAGGTLAAMCVGDFMAGMAGVSAGSPVVGFGIAAGFVGFSAYSAYKSYNLLTESYDKAMQEQLKKQ